MRDRLNTEKQGVDELMPLVYQELRRLAAHYLVSERQGHTLRPTALVHEAYLRLAGASRVWESRGAFCAAAAHAMRRILVDHARGRRRQKRGSGAATVSIDEAAWLPQESPPDLLELDEALNRLALLDARKCRIVELLFFAGLTYDECAAAINLSPATLHRELRLAKAWLCNELSSIPRQHREQHECTYPTGALETD